MRPRPRRDAAHDAWQQHGWAVARAADSVAEDGMTLSRQAITQHLDMLQKAGLVRVEWSGRTKIHSLDPGPLREAVNLWLRNHL